MILGYFMVGAIIVHYAVPTSAIRRDIAAFDARAQLSVEDTHAAHAILLDEDTNESATSTTGFALDIHEDTNAAHAILLDEDTNGTATSVSAKNYLHEVWVGGGVTVELRAALRVNARTLFASLKKSKSSFTMILWVSQKYTRPNPTELIPHKNDQKELFLLNARHWSETVSLAFADSSPRCNKCPIPTAKDVHASYCCQCHGLKMCLNNFDNINIGLNEDEKNTIDAFFNSRRAKAFKDYMRNNVNSPLAAHFGFCPTSESLPPKEFGKFLEDIEAKAGFATEDPYGQYAGISDIVRLAVLSKFGGVYIDADDEVLTDNFLSLWQGTWKKMPYGFRWCNCNSNNVLAAARNPFRLLQIRDMMMQRSTELIESLRPENFKSLLRESAKNAGSNYKPDQCYDPMVQFVMATTGPTMISNCIKKLRLPSLVSKATEKQVKGFFIKEHSSLQHSAQFNAFLSKGQHLLAPGLAGANDLASLLATIPESEGIVNAQRTEQAW